MRARRALIVLAAGAAAAASAACASPDAAPSFGLRASAAAPARSVETPDGALTLFEVEIANRGDAEARLEGVEADWEADRLDAAGLALRLVPRVRAEPAQRLALPAGARTALLCSVAGDAPPARLRRRIVVSGSDGEGPVRRGAVLAEVPRDDRPPAVLGPPVRGPGWLVENGPETLSGHRRAIVWLGRRPRAAQRFAVDLFRADAEGRTSAGPRAEDHFAFGADVLAVADGTVAAAVDGIPDNAPAPTDRAVEMTHATVAGNHVVLDLGDGRFALLAHLRQGSVRVREGDRVRRGAKLGEIGNSGNSTEPHLHLHVADAASPVDADGLPFVFDAFQTVCGGAEVQLEGLLPSEGSVVAFPGPRENSATTGAPQAAETR